MKIVQLSIENVKCLKAVEITPDGTVQVITGRNAAGKSSVLDAIWLALGGRAASSETVMPIRDGETNAKVTLNLGDLIVTRTWTVKGSTLTVTNADGAKYPSPQAMLDELVGRISFDPLAFTRMSARDQRQVLLDLVNIEEDLTALDRKRAALYQERTEVGRQGKTYGEIPPLDAGVPEVEVSISAVMGQLQQSRELARRIDNEMNKLAKTQSGVEYWQQQMSEAQAGLDKATAAYAEQNLIVAQLPDYPSLADLEQQVIDAESINRRVRNNKARTAAAAELAELRARYDALKLQIDELDHAKSVLLSEAKFPVDGLGFDESGVIYNGVPFCQASSAEQIRVSMSMAMAANPKLRVLRIDDGSLLDADGMVQIAAMAKAADYQCWVERVSDPSESAVVIEDGSVVAR